MIQPRHFSKFLFSLLIFVLTISPSFIPKSANASHIMGGEITARNIGANLYIVSAAIRVDMNGISLGQTLGIQSVDTLSGISTTIAVPLDSITLDSLLDASGSLVTGMETYYYTSDTVSFMFGSINKLSWNTCCRNPSILNINTPSNNSFYIHTYLTVPVAGTVNSTPEFLTPVVSYVPVDSNWQFNQLPFDADGDSLVWSIVAPNQSAVMQTSAWVLPTSNASNIFSIDPFGGQITWKPNTLGAYIAGVLVEEYRGGVKIGEVQRDLSFIVVPLGFTVAKIANMGSLFPVSSNGNYKMSLSAGVPFNVIVVANNANLSNNSMKSFGEPYLSATNPSLFSSAQTSVDVISGYFSWTPSSAQIRSNPYIVTFRVKSGSFYSDETLLIEVGNFTSVQNEAENIVGSSYPNPTQSFLFVPFELESKADVHFEMFDILGNKVSDDVVKQYANGQHVEKFSVEFPSGIYFIRISVDGKLRSSQKFIIQ